MTEKEKFYQNIKKVDGSVRRFNTALDGLIGKIEANENKEDDRDLWFAEEFDDEVSYNRG